MLGRLASLAAALSAVVGTGCAADSGVAHVEVLTSIRHLAPGEAWDLEAQTYRAAYADLLRRNGYRIVVTPISDHSLSEAPLVDVVAPTESLVGSNHDDAETERKADAALAEGAIVKLGARRTGGKRTEIVNAIVGAHDRFEADPQLAHRLLIVLSTGFEQSSITNMADYNLKLNATLIRRRFIDHLRATGQIVDLHGVDVCMLAITSGEGKWSDYNRSRAVRIFWQDYFAAAGARLLGYGASAGSCPPIAMRSEHSR